jgi:hypothetical protein
MGRWLWWLRGCRLGIGRGGRRGRRRSETGVGRSRWSGGGCTLIKRRARGLGLRTKGSRSPGIRWSSRVTFGVLFISFSISARASSLRPGGRAPDGGWGQYVVDQGEDWGDEGLAWDLDLLVKVGKRVDRGVHGGGVQLVSVVCYEGGRDRLAMIWVLTC